MTGRRRNPGLAAYTKPISDAIGFCSAERQLDEAIGDLSDDVRILKSLHHRLAVALKSRQPASIAQACRANVAVTLALQSRMEWCAAFQAGVLATFDVPPAQLMVEPAKQDLISAAMVRSKVTPDILSVRDLVRRNRAA